MLDQLSRHSLIDMTVKAKGDLHIDDHHTVEDTGIALGQALAKALGERRGIMRYASIDLAMDETLTRAAIDVSGRPFLVWNVAFSSPKIGTFDTELVREFFQALAQNAGITLHVDQSLRRQQPPYRRDLLQGGGAGAARGARARSAPAGRRSVDQGQPEGLEPMAIYVVMEPPAATRRTRPTRRRFVRDGFSLLGLPGAAALAALAPAVDRGRTGACVARRR